MIDLEAARALLNLGCRIGEGHRAEEQLRGAVAIHNILRQHRVAYLADEVGMGKTYVALGALALFRHYDPSFRVLVIAPRENIQRKWQKELSNFAAHNVRFADMRVTALDGRPARSLVSCGNLVELVNEASVDPSRDFFVRMSSFSLQLGKSSDDWKRMRDGLRRHLPWLKDEAFDLRNKETFKTNFARALCCALPKFDLVIVDEAHNLKHGFSTSGSARNQVLAHAFGRHADDGDSAPNPRVFPGYGPRAERVLFLSATPLEESYRHVWNQLDMFGLAKGFEELKDDAVPEARKKEVAGKFLVRRVTTIEVGGQGHTKNMYRREWRAGGVARHDEPIRVEDERQRLIVALVQKKVSELLGSKKFNHSFQVGMLASFESFLETAKLKRDDDETIFDDAEQTDDALERDGIDVQDLNRLAGAYRKTFGRELPHPKMDAVVESLAGAWLTGKKSLVFVRRVASVKELKRKLDEKYDDWLIGSLRERLAEPLRGSFDEVVARYRAERAQLGARRSVAARIDSDDVDIELDDRGGHDTFFAWFFRGDGPQGVVSGANIQARFVRASGAFATFFALNHLMDLLDARPNGVIDALAEALGRTRAETIDALRERAAPYLPRREKLGRGEQFEAAQAAAFDLLREHHAGDFAARAQIIWDERYQASRRREHATSGVDVSSALERPTFFTELRRPERAELRARIWPEPAVPPLEADVFRGPFRERELRAQFVATAARLGHAFIDLYVLTMQRRTSLAFRAAEVDTDDDIDQRRIDEYLDLLDAQRAVPVSQARPWGAFDELAGIGGNFDLVVDVNAPDSRSKPLGENARYVASLLRQQQPVGGMAGQVNQTLVRQFRMPGYPFVLVTTDLLQEGEDLHTFCSSVQHYGISWTPSSMEQRTGRIDRVRSQTDRRLSQLDRDPVGEDWLQVYYPFLDDTVEVLQVERVLDRMNTFLRLMHEGLAPPAQGDRRIDVSKAMVATRRKVEAIREQLRSAFPIPEWATSGSKIMLDVDSGVAEAIRSRFEGLAKVSLGELRIRWEAHPPRGALIGEATLANDRRQPFTLLLHSHQGRAVVRCVSPIGRVEPETNAELIVARAAGSTVRIGAILTREERSYDLTVEDDVILGAAEHDAARVRILVQRVVEQADRMEREHFDGERDAPLSDFEKDLRDEGDDD